MWMQIHGTCVTMGDSKGQLWHSFWLKFGLEFFSTHCNSVHSNWHSGQSTCCQYNLLNLNLIYTFHSSVPPTSFSFGRKILSNFLSMIIMKRKRTLWHICGVCVCVCLCDFKLKGISDSSGRKTQIPKYTSNVSTPFHLNFFQPRYNYHFPHETTVTITHPCSYSHLYLCLAIISCSS